MYEEKGSIEEWFDNFRRWLGKDFVKHSLLTLFWAGLCGWIFGSCTCGILMCDCGSSSTKSKVTVTTDSGRALANTSTTTTEEEMEESEFETTGTYRYTLIAPKLSTQKFFLDSYTIDSYGNLTFLELETNKNFIVKGNYFMREDNYYGKKEEKK